MTSRRKHVWVFVLSVIVLAILIIFKPAYGWRLRNLVLGDTNAIENDPSLVSANNGLQAQLAVLENVAAQLPKNSLTNPGDGIRAMVYSQYPFSFKSELQVNAGANAGVAIGNAVTFQGVFVGEISRAFADSASVTTIFDPSFKIPVRIGTKGVDGLLVGGAYPRVVSIAKDAAVLHGDVVYTAAPGFPYGLAVAEVDATSTSADKLFKEASLNFVYDVNNIRAVFIAR